MIRSTTSSILLVLIVSFADAAVVKNEVGVDNNNNYFRPSSLADVHHLDLLFSARNLPNSDPKLIPSLQPADCYANVEYPNGDYSFYTSTAWNDLNPDWPEVFSIVNPVEDFLEVHVWDDDSGITIGLEWIGQSYIDFMELLNAPDQILEQPIFDGDHNYEARIRVQVLFVNGTMTP